MGNIGLDISLRKFVEEMMEGEAKSRKTLKAGTTATAVSFKGIPIRNGRVLKIPDRLAKYQKRKTQQSILDVA